MALKMIIGFLFLYRCSDLTAAAKYVIKTLTSTRINANTMSPVYLSMKGNSGEVKEFPLKNPINRDSNVFERGSLNIYEVEKPDIGIVCLLKVRHFGTDGWHLVQISVQNTKIHRYSAIVFEFDKLIDDFGIEYRSFKVNGGWSDWSSWSLMGKTCDENTLVYRNKSCNSPSPGCNGSYCKGISEQKLPCTSLKQLRRNNESKIHPDTAVDFKTSSSSYKPTEKSQSSNSRLLTSKLDEMIEREKQEKCYPRILYIGSVTSVATLILVVFIAVTVMMKKALLNASTMSGYFRQSDDADNIVLKRHPNVNQDA